jgi:cobalt-zinc-cadmium efflux system outer membrane protein
MTSFTRNRIMKNHIIVLALMAGTAAAPTSVAAPLTREAAVHLALRANPALRAAAHEVAAQDGAITQARALPNPEFEFLREGQDRSKRTTTAQLGIPIELGGKRAARVDAARREQDVAAAELDALRARVRADAIAAFYEAVAAPDPPRLAQELAALAQRAAGAAARRVDAGKAPPLEATRANVAQANARIEALQAVRELEGARIRLAALWGGKAAEIELAVPGSLELPAALPLAQLEARLALSPASRRAQAVVTHQESLAGVERSKRTPDVTLIVGTRRENPDSHQQAVLGVSLPLPLFNRNGGALLASLRRVDKARDELEAERLRLHAELAQAHARLTAALAEAAMIAADIVPGAEEAFRLAGRGYELGKFGLLDVLDAQRAFFQARHQYIKAVADSHRASADIERLVGPATQENP